MDTYLQDTNALGLRFRYIRSGAEAAATEQWFQIRFAGQVLQAPTSTPAVLDRGVRDVPGLGGPSGTKGMNRSG